MDKILSLCRELNDLVTSSTYQSLYDIPNDTDYDQTFISIDAIEDTQGAISAFTNANSPKERGQNILLIYGFLQALFVQQDGLHNLYRCVFNSDINQKDFFDKFSFDNEIRNVRNDIAGHPTNRKRDTEFYFFDKSEQISKDKFVYAGYYISKFKSVEVDSKAFVRKQAEFTKSVLKAVRKEVLIKIKEKEKSN